MSHTIRRVQVKRQIVTALTYTYRSLQAGEIGCNVSAVNFLSKYVIVAAASDMPQRRRQRHWQYNNTGGTHLAAPMFTDALLSADLFMQMTSLRSTTAGPPSERGQAVPSLDARLLRFANDERLISTLFERLN